MSSSGRDRAAELEMLLDHRQLELEPQLMQEAYMEVPVKQNISQVRGLPFKIVSTTTQHLSNLITI